MQFLTLKARAKINVGLDVIGKRADGYHEVRTVMQTIGLYDLVYIKKIEKRIIKLTTNIKWLPDDRRNLVYRAAEFLIDEFKIDSGVFIGLTKSIPICAGLAGGSSDCAATLVGMRNLFGLPLTNTKLTELAMEFGADVPYCVMRGTALAQGRGEVLTKLPPHPRAYVLLAKPPISIGTAAVFKKLDISRGAHPDIDSIVGAIQRKSLSGVAAALGNTLESVTETEHPIITELKRIMLDNGALGAQMSGSGPTVFGYYSDKQRMLAAAAAIAHELPQVRDVFRSYIYNP